jgi:hypothetical protein
MGELILNGGFEINTPSGNPAINDTFADWPEFPGSSLIKIGSGLGIGGTDCASLAPQNNLEYCMLRQTQGEIIIPNYNYNLSVYAQAPIALSPAEGGFECQIRTEPPATGPSINQSISVLMQSLTVGTYTQYTVNFTSPKPFIPGAFTTLVSIVVNTFNIIPASGNPVYVDDVSLTGVKLCMHGDTMIKTRELETGKEFLLPVADLDTNKHEVFSLKKNDYVKIVRIFTSGPVSRLFKIPEGTLGEEQKEPLLLTGGHKVLHDGKEIKTSRLKGAKRVKYSPPVVVYTIVLSEEDFIIGNGAYIKAPGEKDFGLFLDTQQ